MKPGLLRGWAGWGPGLRRTGLALPVLAVAAVLLDRLFPLPPAPQYSPLVTAADGSVLHAFLNPTQK